MLKRGVNIILRVIAGIFLLLFLCFIILTIPAVQTFIAQEFTSKIFKNKGVFVQIEKIKIGLDGQLKMQNVYVEDHHQDTLINFNQFQTSIFNVKNILDNDFHLSGGRFQDLTLKIIHYEGEEYNNFDYLIKKLPKNKPKDSLKERKKIKLHLDYLLATDSRLVVKDFRKESPDLIEMNQLNFNLRDLRVLGSNVELQLLNLNGITADAYVLEDLKTNFKYTPTKMNFKNTYLQTDVSSLSGDIEMKYAKNNLSDFANQVIFDAKINDAKISSMDLSKIYNEFGYGEKINLQAELKGSLNNFNLYNLKLDGLKKTSLTTNQLKVKNLLDRQENFILEGNFDELTTDFVDLANLLPRIIGNNIPDALNRFGVMDFQGYAKVDETNLITDLNVITEVGKAYLNLDFKDLNQSKQVTYKGELIFEDIQLNKILLNDQLGLTSFDLDIDGRSFEIENLATNLQGNFDAFTYRGYTYRNIDVNGNLQDPIFNGTVSSNDENFKFEFKGLADLSEGGNTYDFEAQIEYADLVKTNLFTKDSIAQLNGNIIMDVQGNSLNNATGNLKLKDFNYINSEGKFEFEDLYASSIFDGDVRKISINAPEIIQGEINGIYKLTELPIIIREATENLYFKQKRDQREFAYVDFELAIYDKAIEAIFPEIRFEAGTHIDGSIVANENYFRINFNSPEIEAYGNLIKGINLQINNQDPLVNTIVSIDELKTSFYEVNDFSLINQTQNDTLFIRSRFKGGKENSDLFDINLYQTATNEDELIVGFNPSKITYKEYEWNINKKGNTKNKVSIDRNFKNFSFDSITLSHDQAKIELVGFLNEGNHNDLKLELNQVELDKILPQNEKLHTKGLLTGKLHYFQNEDLISTKINTQIIDFEVNNYIYGDLNLNANGEDEFDNFDIALDLKNKQDMPILLANGEIFRRNNQQEYAIDIVSKELPLAPISPIGGDIIKQIRGLASANLKLTGVLSQPVFNGTVEMAKAGLQVPYLNVDINFLNEPTVNLFDNDFIFTGVEIQDTKYQTTGRLDGFIESDFFTNWVLDLNISGENLLVLDTPYKEGALYYGTAFITGNSEITGPTDELNINVNARTNKNTVFKIPLDDSEFLSEANYIYFLTPEDKLAQIEGRGFQIDDVKGIEMNFDLDITEDAEVEIVVDKNSGSSLKGRGTGNLLIEINTIGKFTMFGDFEVAEGIYDFKYAGIVNKKFNVQPGGTVVWNGDPFRANMDVQAIYKTQANPAMVLENPSINRDIPVEVKINLNGEIIQPDINFEINYPNLSSIVKSELDYRIQGRENTEIQALSLVAQGTFYNIDGIGGQGAIAGNLVEGASSIMDGLLADEDGKIKVGLDYTQAQRVPDQNQTGDRVGMSFQTQITDRVLINGRFGVPVGGTTESFIFGNVEVNILLNESGSLQANVFNRESDVQFVGEELAYTQGVGISYAVDFNTFKELFEKILLKEEERKQKQQERKNHKDQPEQKKSVLPSHIRLPHENIER